MLASEDQMTILYTKNIDIERDLLELFEMYLEYLACLLYTSDAADE